MQRALAHLQREIDAVLVLACVHVPGLAHRIIRLGDKEIGVEDPPGALFLDNSSVIVDLQGQGPGVSEGALDASRARIRESKTTLTSAYSVRGRKTSAGLRGLRNPSSSTLSAACSRETTLLSPDR